MRMHWTIAALALSVWAGAAWTGCGKSDEASKADSGNASPSSDHKHEDAEAGEGHANHSESDPHDHPITEADVEMPANYAEAVSRIKSYRDAIREGAGSDTPGLAHRPLDELDIVLRKLPAIARDSGVPPEKLETINLSARELRDLFNQVHEAIDENRAADFPAVADKIQEAISRLETVKSSAADHSQHGSDHPAEHQSGHESAVLMVDATPAAPIAGQSVALQMMIHDVNGTMVREFDVVHEKLVHFIIVRDGLDEFAHEHPEVDGQGNLTIAHTFPKAGKYHLFADYKPMGKSASVARAEFVVTGDPSPAPPLAVNAPGKVNADGFVADIEVKNAKAGQESEIRFRLADDSGQPINDLQPYLGARGHLVVLSSDGVQYVHAHPMDESTASNEVVFMSHFPAAGTYKGWAQFQQAGQVRTLPFVVQIP